MTTAISNKPILAITMGDANGVSPEIILKALNSDSIHRIARLAIVGSHAALTSAQRVVPSARRLCVAGNLHEAAAMTGGIPVVDLGLNPGPWEPGQLRAEAGRCAVEWFREGVRAAMAGEVDGVVTCPLNKEGIHMAGYTDFPGHTEMAAVWTDTPDYRMSLFAGGMRSVFVTAHAPLREALAMITPERIIGTIRIGHEALQRMGIAAPRIGVAGINPHAGENGILGREDLDLVRPAVEACRSRGIDCAGPLVPDAVFRHMQEGKFDLVVSMYHDQGHIPLKLVAMDEGVNVTLGLPIVRTSVDHGTAYDIAGRGEAREASLLAAINLAARLASKG